jgi:hypothetical protein
MTSNCEGNDFQSTDVSRGGDDSGDTKSLDPVVFRATINTTTTIITSPPTVTTTTQGSAI